MAGSLGYIWIGKHALSPVVAALRSTEECTIAPTTDANLGCRLTHHRPFLELLVGMELLSVLSAQRTIRMKARFVGEDRSIREGFWSAGNDSQGAELYSQTSNTE